MAFPVNMPYVLNGEIVDDNDPRLKTGRPGAGPTCTWCCGVMLRPDSIRCLSRCCCCCCLLLFVMVLLSLVYIVPVWRGPGVCVCACAAFDAVRAFPRAVFNDVEQLPRDRRPGQLPLPSVAALSKRTCACSDGVPLVHARVFMEVCPPGTRTASPKLPKRLEWKAKPCAFQLFQASRRQRCP